MNKPMETPLPVQAVGDLASKTHNMGTILASQTILAETSVVSGPIRNPSALGGRFFLTATDVGSAPANLSLTIEVQDPASREWVALVDPVLGIAGVGTAVMTIYPGVDPTSEASYSNHLGDMFRVKVAVTQDDAVFSVGGVFLD